MGRSSGGGGRGGGPAAQKRFVSRAMKAIGKISSRQRNFRRSQGAYRRLERARDIIAGGRSSILYRGGNMKSPAVRRARGVISDIAKRGLDKAVTFGPMIPLND